MSDGSLVPGGATLDNPFAQACVLSRQQLLRQIVTALVGILRRAGKMMIDPHLRGTAEVIREREELPRPARR